MNELQTFLLEGHGIRGALVRLEETWRQVIAQHDYPQDLERVLGEGVAATVLLAGTLKAKPQVSLQLQSDGPLKLLLVQCSVLEPRPGPLKVRGMAQGRAARTGETLLREGRLAVNVDPGGRSAAFQGIVPLVDTRLDASLEAYFRQSEQLPTRLVLRSGDVERGAPRAGTGRSIAGLLLQPLPGHDFAPEIFEEAALRARTVSSSELAQLPAQALLPKLFEPFQIRLFKPRPVLHDCRCTPAHIAGVMRLLGDGELESLLVDPGWVEITCEFCNRAFRYGYDDIEAVLRGESPGPLLH